MRNKLITTSFAGFSITGTNPGSLRFLTAVFFLTAFFSLFTAKKVSGQFLLNSHGELYWVRSNVGIGIYDPTHLLHLRYNNTNTVTSHLYLEQDSTGDAFMQYGLTGGRHYAMGIDNSTGGFFKIGTHPSTPRGVNTNTLFTLTPEGRLGLGTDDPSRLLHLRYNNTNTVTSQLYLEQDGTGDAFMQFGLSGGRHYAMGIDNSGDGVFKIGTHANAPLGVGTNTLFTLTPTGNVGIGVSSPSAKLEINGDLRLRSSNNNTFRMFTDTDGDFKFVADDDVIAMTITDESARVGIGTSEPSGALEIHSDSDYGRPTLELTEEGTDAARIYFRNTTNDSRRFGIGANPGDDDPNLSIGYNNGSGTVNILNVDGDNHRVGIMTDNVPDGYRLGVDGRIICEEVRVQLSSDWGDYVFEKDYDLMPLDELEKSIAANKHLPGIPSAAEVEKQGLSVGDMQSRMMVKLEELTLYVLQLKKENEVLKEQINQLQK